MVNIPVTTVEVEIMIQVATMLAGTIERNHE